MTASGRGVAASAAPELAEMERHLGSIGREIEDADPRAPWREPEPGDRYEGRILRLPRPGTHDGNSVYLHGTDGLVYRLPATARKGQTVLEHELEKTRVGDDVTLYFRGWRSTRDGEREYRLWEVDVHG